MKCLIILIMLMLAMDVLGQKLAVRKQDILTSILRPKKYAKDSCDLQVKVVFHNTSNNSGYIYSYFEGGYLNDEDCDIHIAMEHFVNGRYTFFPLRYYQKLKREGVRPDTCYDLPKKALSPKSSDTIALNLLSVGSYFKKGKYRYKIFIRERFSISGPLNMSENPPEIQIGYFKSDWIYFETTKDILVLKSTSDQ